MCNRLDMKGFDMFTYWKVDFRLISEMLGTATEASIYDKHILQKAKKEIQKANKLSGKITKAVQKYKGQEIPEQKEVEELKSVIRAYQGVVGKITELPDSVEEEYYSDKVI